ncbi:MAG TPA: exonuclease domain-containing protein [Myxococcota bacterium]|nr:exonuclease domain-containing protein [Myxococcota bacterium]
MNFARGSIRAPHRESSLECVWAALRTQGKPLALGDLAQRLLVLRAPPPPEIARRVVAALLGSAAAALPDPIDLRVFGVHGAPCRPPSERSQGATRQLCDVEFVVVDLETTGLSPRTCSILEIGAVRVAAVGATEGFATLVNPQVPIPPAIRAFTGIDDAMVAGAPPLAEALRAFLGWLAQFPGAPLVAHNASFDAGFLVRGLAGSGLPPLARDVLCTRRLAKRVLPELRRLGLQPLSYHFGVVNRAPHRALGDAEATADVLLCLLDLARSRAGVETLEDLLALHAQSPAKVRKGLRPLPEGLWPRRSLEALPA